MEVLNKYTPPATIQDMVGYDHLYNMCKNIRNVSSSFYGYENPITPRLKYIIDSLELHSIEYNVKEFERETSDKKLANVIVEFKGSDEELDTIFFTAHHDIVNPKSENCQDNTASICNLIHLAKLINEQKLNLKQNVVIAFTDLEESGGAGIDDLIKEIDEGLYGSLDCLYALELSANGSEIWISGSNKDSYMVNKVEEVIQKDIHIVRTPYNESVNVRDNYLEGCCIGTLSDEEIKVVNERGYCNTWSLCHSDFDTFELSANKEDMNNFVNTLFNLVVFD
jgi:hypothetical protein